MTEERFWELVNRELDGELTPAEREEMTAALGSDPRWQTLRTELVDVDKLLARQGEVEVPEGFATGVMTRIPNRRQAVSVSSRIKAGWQALCDDLSYRYVYTFASGAVVGAAILALVLAYTPSGVPLSERDLTGTIYREPGGDDTEQIAYSPIETEPLHGSLEVTRTLDRVTAVLAMNSHQSVDLRLFFRSAQMSLTDFSRIGDTDYPILMNANGLQTTFDGEARYDIVWARTSSDTATIRIELYAEELIYELDLDIP
jgi:hypothetical protein